MLDDFGISFAKSEFTAEGRGSSVGFAGASLHQGSPSLHQSLRARHGVFTRDMTCDFPSFEIFEIFEERHSDVEDIH